MFQWLVNEDYTTTEFHRPATPGPPPAYEAVVVPLNNKDTVIDLTKEQSDNDTDGLPTYETAVRQLRQITQNGYV